MPLMEVKVGDKLGYKYGDNGHVYTYTVGDEEGRKEAKRKAIIQGTAIANSTGEKLQLEKSDFEDLLEKDEKEKIYEFDEDMIKDDSNNTLFGWAYVRETKDGKQVVDHSEDFCKSENFKDLEIATYAFNLAYREGDINHTPLDNPPTGYLIESMVFSKEKMAKMKIPEGILPEAVWMGFYFPNDTDYQMIKSMSHPMFSLFGKVSREFVEEI
jgi:hypothetical protein